MSVRKLFLLLCVVGVMAGVECDTDVKNWRNFVSRIEDDSLRDLPGHQDSKSLQDEQPLVIDLTGVDPCEDITCPTDEICIAHEEDLARCIPNEDITEFIVDGHCSPCHHHHVHGHEVCSEEGDQYRSRCELEYQACRTDTDIRVACTGPCPCQIQREIPEPRHLYISSLPNDVSTSRIFVSWEPPIGFETPGDVEGYVLHYTRVGSTGWSEVKTPGVIKSINIAGLVSGSEYYFRIEAKSEGVKGRMSDAIFFKTDKLGRVSIENGLASDTEGGDITDDEDASGDDSYFNEE